VEFMAALLTSVSGSTDDVVKYINECREMGIPVERPDINVSDAYFTPHGEAIRFGLAAVKNVGHNAIESIVAARKSVGTFNSIFQFCEKVDLHLLNKRVIESLIKSGAMDPLGRRAQLLAVIDSAMEHAAKTQKDAALGQHGLFGVFQQDDESSSHGKALPNLPDREEHERLADEKEILGFFITGHPLEKYRDKLLDFGALTSSDVANLKSSTGRDEILIGGMLGNIRVAKSKKGDLYAQGQLEDMSGSVDILCFADSYKRLSEKLRLAVPVLVKGSVRVEEGSNSKLMISDITALEQAQPKLPSHLRIKVPLENVSAATIDDLHALCRERKGEAKVLFDLERKGDFTVVMEAEGYNVLPDRAFIHRVEELCGRGSVRVVD
jgi:DNA polymerase III subunit alpha